ncbi:sodium/potassium/calcium exchanger 5-like [Montipora capricornis]|uniref:sodium/potassium/calcium exchanger 5-like n=1 Tax=Montipora capricornis TaxID=246305 RepID=UPI0035F10DA3
MKFLENCSQFAVPFVFIWLLFPGLFYTSKALTLSQQTEDGDTGVEAPSRTRRIAETPANENNSNPTSMGKLSLPCSKPSMDNFPGDFMSQEMRVHGGAIVHLFLVVYMFIGLTILCDHYFVPSVEKMGRKLHLNRDVCGATLMAMATSGSELCTSIIGVFITKSDIGLATMAGSMAFDSLFIVAICGLFASSTLRLSRWPLVRDNLGNLVSVTALTVVTYDRKVYWYEAVGLLSLYFLYCVVMCYNNSLERIFKGTESHTKRFVDVETELTESENKKLIPTHDNSDEDTMRGSAIHEIQVIRSNNDPQNSLIYNIMSSIQWVIMLPFTCLYSVTIPDCRKGRWENWCLLTFLISVVWMSLLCYLLVWMVAIIGFTLDIPDAVMGLTFMAAASSAPSALSSLVVTWQGEGDMAVSQANGSNMFNVLFCLGFPWLLQTTVVDMGGQVTVISKGMTFTTLCLYAAVVLPFVIIMFNKWYLNKCLGIAFIILYLSFTAIFVLFGINMFGKFSLRMCTS